MFSPSRGKSNASFDSTLEKVPKAVFILVMGVGRRVGGQFLNLSYPPPLEEILTASMILMVQLTVVVVALNLYNVKDFSVPRMNSKRNLQNTNTVCS